MAQRHPQTGERLVEGVNADRRGGKLRPRDLVGATFEPAIKSLTEFGQTLEAGLPGQIQQLETEAGITRAGLEAERARGEELLGLRRGEAEQRTESAIAEARRQSAELGAGIQARFGAQTGTGPFAGELLGRETLRTTGAHRVALQESLGELDAAETDLDRTFTNQMEALNLRLTESKEALRRELRERIAQINIQKGMLEAQKGQMRLEALQRFAAQQSAVEAEARQFERELELIRFQRESDLDQLRESVLIRSGVDRGGTGGGVARGAVGGGGTGGSPLLQISSPVDESLIGRLRGSQFGRQASSLGEAVFRELGLI